MRSPALGCVYRGLPPCPTEEIVEIITISSFFMSCQADDSTGFIRNQDDGDLDKIGKEKRTQADRL